MDIKTFKKIASQLPPHIAVLMRGPTGVGKTEIGKVLAKIMNTDLIRLQCYEGLDVHNSIYEWNYSRQILQIRMMELEGKVNKKTITDEIFGSKFLLQSFF